VTSRSLRAGGALSALVGLALPLLSFTPAAAEPGTVVARPIANDDSFAVYASADYRFDVLANDRTTVLSSGELTLCGVSVDDVTQQVLYAEIDRDDPSLIYLETKRTASGVVTFTYDACQGNSRDTSTVTVDISRLAPPKVRKHKLRRAKIVAVNPNEAALQIVWGSNRSNVSDGERSIPALGRIRITVKRTSIYWVAYLRDQGSIVIVGEGTVKKIKRKKG
jgi:hypothetical protein